MNIFYKNIVHGSINTNGNVHIGDVLQQSKTFLIRNDYYTMMIEIIELERISVGDYLEYQFQQYIQSNPNFIEILYKDISFVLEGIYKVEDLSFEIQDGDFVIEYGDIKLTGSPNNLIYATIWLHEKIVEKFSDQDYAKMMDKKERFENDFLKINYNTIEYNTKIDELRQKLIKDKLKSSPNQKIL